MVVVVLAPSVTLPVTPPLNGEQSSGARPLGIASMRSEMLVISPSVTDIVTRPNSGVCTFTTPTLPATRRHVIGPPIVEAGQGGLIRAQTPFMVVRTMHSGEPILFASGRYDDRIMLTGPDAPRFAEKTVVLDSRQIDTLLAIPL